MKAGKATALIVDNVDENISILKGLLESKYDIQVALNAYQAIEIARKESPEIIFLDVAMPDLNGYDVLTVLNATSLTANIPVVLMASQDQYIDEPKGLALGAVDCFSKPITHELISPKLHQYTLLKKSNDRLALSVQQRSSQLKKSKDSILLVMGLVAQHRDPETCEHLQRTRAYVHAMTKALANNPDYRDQIPDDFIEIFAFAAPLHDIGKVGVSDDILLKPGKLTRDEFELMKNHAMGGEEIVIRAQQYLSEPELLDIAKDIVGGHHEKWDGTGYPRGLKGEQIPLSARIMAYADVYDALVSVRPYKTLYSHEFACDLIKKDVGTHFDPNLYVVFEQIKEQFREIATQFRAEKEGTL